MGQHPLIHRLPRQRMGRSPPRRPAPVRVPNPRRRPSRPVLGADPPQTRSLPRRLRPLRPHQNSRLRPRQNRRIVIQPRHNPQPPKNRRRHRQRPSLPQNPAGTYHLRRLHLAIRQRRPPKKRLARPPRNPRIHPPIRRNEPPTPPPRFPLRRPQPSATPSCKPPAW